MSLKRKIFLDLDGVVVNFVIPAMRFWNANIEGEHDYPDGCGWDILKATNIYREAQGRPPLDAKTFWDGLNYGFWRHLPLYPFAHQFVESMETYGEVYFATSPTLSSACVAGKFDHIAEEFPRLRRRLIISADKTVLAQPGAILIDDRDRNVSKFIEAGGQAVLVPRPWNDLGHVGTSAALVETANKVSELCVS